VAGDQLSELPTVEAEEAVTHAARTLIEFTTLPEGALLRVVKAGLRELSADSLAQVEREARELRRTRQAEEVERTRAALADLARTTGVGVADLFPELVPAKTRTGGGKAVLPVKYRGPQGEEWTGRGHSPKWLQALEAQGRNREEFEVK
jgi:DNA-binding protein H-NS